jgi:hypothetical protein
MVDLKRAVGIGSLLSYVHNVKKANLPVGFLSCLVCYFILFQLVRMPSLPASDTTYTSSLHSPQQL